MTNGEWRAACRRTEFIPFRRERNEFRSTLLVALLGLAFIGIPSSARAQSLAPREQLLRLVPGDAGLCLVIADLRGHSARWETSSWAEKIKDSVLGRAFLESPELRDLAKFRNDLKKHLDIEWETLRNDILGDAIVFVYQPGPTQKPEQEQGLLLVHARRPDLLSRLVDNLNRIQKASGELKSLEPRTYQGVAYFQRTEPRQTHYYLMSGAVFAYAGKEEMIRQVIDRQLAKEPAAGALRDHLQKAGSEKDVAALWINPRAFDADVKQKEKDLPGPDGDLLKEFLEHWAAFEGIVASLAWHDTLEVKFTLFANEKALPAATRRMFTEPAKPSDVWRRLPDDAILSMAGHLDIGEVAEYLTDLMPAEVRKSMKTALGPLAALAGLDLTRDVLPNIGPDWGLCVLPATDPKKVPQVLFALAVKPGPKELALDKALYRGITFLAGLSLFDYNRRHPQDPIYLRTFKQDQVEMRYMENDKVFPPGFEPACALKDGYLLLTTSREAVERFRPAKDPAPDVKEAPLLRLSATSLAKVLREHQDAIITQVAAKNQITREAATQGLDGALSVLDLFDRVEVAQSAGGGQSRWVMRVSPAKSK